MNIKSGEIKNKTNLTGDTCNFSCYSLSRHVLLAAKATAGTDRTPYTQCVHIQHSQWHLRKSRFVIVVAFEIGYSLTRGVRQVLTGTCSRCLVAIVIVAAFLVTLTRYLHTRKNRRKQKEREKCGMARGAKLKIKIQHQQRQKRLGNATCNA